MRFPLRRSEVLGLKWEAINFDKGILSVYRKITSIFDDGHEQLMLEMQYYQMLKSDFDRTFDGFFCRDNTGATITPEYATRHFKEVVRKYKLRPLRFHDLRHSCASLLLASGVSMKAIQDWLGHSTFNVTANFYSHLDYQSRISSAEVIANALGGEAETEKNKDTNKKNRLLIQEPVFMVPVTGVEPVRYRYHRILSPTRLPIPSHRHITL